MFQVLIIYVMNPPVSKAIQGAYFVAALFTGVVFGGGSVMFADVTEGLGCLLGGFSLSMWFLVLTPGGLVTSTAGKAILIACFALGTFGLYLIHYTRPYALIASISFAGATVITLGVDCFSRAGLKEFWLYLWDLNHDLFPPHYDRPYPITRGIRVETICTIIVFILGIMSQMKIWKVIKDRKDKKAMALLDEEQRRDQAEENLGRNLEAGNDRERAMWEAVYGDKEFGKKQVDSGVGTDEPGSLRKGSISAVGSREIRHSGTESIEMSNLEGTNDSSQRISSEGIHTLNGSRVMTVRVASDDHILQTPLPGSEQPKSLSPPAVGASTTQHPSELAQEISSAVPTGKEPNADRDATKPREFPSGPKIVPLPFCVPESGLHNDDDGSSIATFAASDQPLSRSSKRFSGGSILRGLTQSSQRHMGNDPATEEVLIPHDEDDRASSVAATIDDISTDRDSDAGDAFHGPAKPVLQLNQGPPEGPVLADHPSLKNTSDTTTISGLEHIANVPLSNPTSVSTLKVTTDSPITEGSALEPLMEDSFAGQKQPGSSSQALGLSVEQGAVEPLSASPKELESDDKPTKLGGSLPESTSKLVMAFRTNEWAKHLEAAETPELPELDLNSENNSDGLTLMRTDEAAAPLHITELQQTPLTAEPAPILNDRSQEPPAGRSATSMSRNTSMDRSLHRPAVSSRPLPSGINVERSVSQISLQSTQGRKESPGESSLRLTPSQNSLNPGRGHRSGSTQITSSPLVGSPIAEGVETSFPPRFTPSPKHLMSQRDSMMRNRASSTSLNRNPSSNSLNRNGSSNSLNRNGSSTPLNRNGSSNSLNRHGSSNSLNRNDSSNSVNRNVSPFSPQPAGSSDSLPFQNERLATLDEDNIPLSQRKSLLQQQQLSQHPSRASLPLQPQRSSSASNPRETTLSAWRSSLRADLPAQQAVQEIESRRSEMLSEKRRASTSQQWAAIEAERRESGIERGMRRGDFQDKHREAMRRMQAGANKHV